MLNQMQMSEIALARSLQNQYTYAPAQSPPTMFHQQQPMPQPMYVKLIFYMKLSVLKTDLCRIFWLETQLNNYGTATHFIQLTQNLTSDCLLI